MFWCDNLLFKNKTNNSEYSHFHMKSFMFQNKLSHLTWKFDCFMFLRATVSIFIQSFHIIIWKVLCFNMRV